MADARTPSRNRRFGEKRMGRKFIIFVGDCNQAGEALANKPITPFWFIISFLDTLLRSYGQVVFCNNPVTGLLIMIALFISAPFVALVGLTATSVAIFTAWLIDQPEAGVRAGVYSYNALLVGQLTAVLLPEMHTVDWSFMIVGAIFSVYFTSAFSALFGSISKHPMPALTAPFVLAQVLVYLCATSPGALYFKEPTPTTANVSLHLSTGSDFVGSTLIVEAVTNDYLSQSLEASISNATDVPEESLIFEELSESGSNNEAVTVPFDSRATASTIGFDLLDWGEIFAGVLKSLGQVYGQEHLPASLLMYVGVIICSPTIALMGLFGSTISTVVGALLRPSPQAPLGAGAWGFNGFLSAGAVGGFALVLTPQAGALAQAAALLAGVVQYALLASFDRADVPLLTLPFNLATLLLLCATARGRGSLVRPPALSYPEKHRRDWRAERQAARSLNIQSAIETLQEDEGEKPENFRKLETV